MNQKKDSQTIESAVKACREYTDLDIEKLTAQVMSYSHPISALARSKSVGPQSQSNYEQRIAVSEIIAAEDKAFAAFIGRISRWWPVSPGKQNASDKIRETYLPAIEDLDVSESRYANIFSNTTGECKFDHALQGKNGLIIVQGARGAGKTAFLNYWLSERHDRLLKNDTHWFRIDAAKVFDIYKEIQSESIRLDVKKIIDRYMVIHTLYVILMYAGVLGDEGADDPTRMTTNQSFQTWAAAVKNIDTVAFNDVLNVFARPIRSWREGNPAQRDISQFVVKNIVCSSWENDNLYVQKIFQIFKRFCSEISKRSKIIIFLDGVDNIAWTQRSLFYNQVCSKIGEIFANWATLFLCPIKFVIAMRPETASEFGAVDGMSLVGFNNENPDSNSQVAMLDIFIPCVKKIIVKKIEAAQKSAFEVEREDAIGSIISSMEGQTRLMSEDLLRKILSEMLYSASTHEPRAMDTLRESVRLADHFTKERLYSKFQEESFEARSGLSSAVLVDLIFDGDVRSYIENFINVFFIRRALSDRIPGNETDTRLIQYMLFNGRPYFFSKADYNKIGEVTSRANFTDRGAVVPNIFWYDTDQFYAQGARWGGLVGLRILQCAELRSDYSVGDLIYSVEKMFGYPRSQIIESVETFIAFGMLDIRVPDGSAIKFTVRSIDEDKGYKDLKKYSAKIYITRKGSFFIRYIWTRFDILYFYALDTPLLNEYVVKSSKYVRFTRDFDDLRSIENFYKASIFTLTTFLMHVKSFHKKEMDIDYKSKFDCTADFDNLYQSNDRLRRGLQLPIYIDDFYISFIRKALRNIHDKGSYSDVIDDINGLFRSPSIYH